MAKIPVGKTISHAYSFAFGNILNILGVAWFPYLIMGVGGYLLLMPYIAAMQEFVATQDMSGLAGAVLLMLLFVVLCVVGISMVTVEVMREALGMDPGRKYFYFSLDKPVWRLIGAYLLVILILIGLGIAAAIVLAILSNIVGESAAAVVSTVGGVIVFLAMILIAVRLIFLLPAIVVAENHISIRRGYHLTYGNFWRIVVVYLAIFIPVALIQYVVQMVIFGTGMMDMNPAATGEEIAANLEQLQAALKSGLLLMIPVWIAGSILNIALASGAGAFAYRTLTGSPGGQGKA